MSDVDVEGLARVIAEAMPGLTSVDRSMARFIYRRLARGEPVPPSAIAEHCRVTSADIEERLEAWPGVETSSVGEVISFWGLALGGMPHGFAVGEQRLTTWCAWDAFFIPGIIGVTAQVRSTCPVTDEAISLEISPAGVASAEPAGVAVSIQRPTKAFGEDVVPEF